MMLMQLQQLLQVEKKLAQNSIDKVQGIVSGAVTAVTAVTVGETGNNPMDTQTSLPPTKALQTRSETIRNAGETYSHLNSFEDRVLNYER